MGNTTSGETKTGGKAGKLKKIRGKRGKSEEPQFSGAIVAEEAKPSSELKTTKSEQTVKVIETPVRTPEELWKTSPSMQAPQLQQLSQPLVPPIKPARNKGEAPKPPGMKQQLKPPQQKPTKEETKEKTDVDKAIEEIKVETPVNAPPSKESSSESHFTDPLLTPIEFSAEMNECYYSQESVLDVPVSDPSTSAAPSSRQATNHLTLNLNGQQIHLSTPNEASILLQNDENLREQARKNYVRAVLERLSVSEMKQLEYIVEYQEHVDQIQNKTEDNTKNIAEDENIADEEENSVSEVFTPREPLPKRASDLNLHSIGKNLFHLHLNST